MFAVHIFALGFALFAFSAVNGQSSSTPVPDSTGASDATGSTGASTCTDNAENCDGLSNLCTDAVYYALMTTNCASTCDRCVDPTPAPGTCADLASNCVNYTQYCANPSYADTVQKYCQKTCNNCPAGTCQDSSASCPSWKNNGFCVSTFYSADYKKQTCGVTCALC